MRKQSQNRHDSSKAWQATSLVSLMAAMASADNIHGIGFREFDHWRGRESLSMMGGAKMMIRTDGGLHDQAGSNYIKYSSWSQQVSLDLYSGLSRDDEFYSHPAEGKLAFTTPSVMELFNADSISDFNGAGLLDNGWGGNSIDLWTSVVGENGPDQSIWC
jgi:hypothetical protein